MPFGELHEVGKLQHLTEFGKELFVDKRFHCTQRLVGGLLRTLHVKTATYILPHDIRQFGLVLLDLTVFPDLLRLDLVEFLEGYFIRRTQQFRFDDLFLFEEMLAVPLYAVVCAYKEPDNR